MTRLSILIIPPNDLLRHPIPNRLYHIAKRLAQRYNIYLLSFPCHPLAKPTKLRHLDCVEISFKPIATVKDLGLYYMVNAPSIRETLVKLFSRNQIDVMIHGNILPSYIAVKIASKHDIPVIYDYLDHFPQSASAYYVNVFIGKLVESYVLSLIEYNMKLSTYIITVSYTLRRLIADIIKDEQKISVIPNGVDPELFRPIPTEKARREVGLEDYEHVALYYGSFDVWLDFETIFRAVKHLKKTLDKLVLVLIGISHNTTVYSMLRSLIAKYGLQKSVVFYPPQPYEKIPLYINASDLVVASYRKILKNYVTPLKLFEALACAKPVITTDIPEFKLWLRKMPVAYYRNHNELTELIPKILKSYDTIRFDLVKTSEEVRTRFSWNTLAGKYEALIGFECKP